MNVRYDAKKLLNALSQTANAQVMLLTFCVPIDTDDVSEILLRNLQAGTFQHEFILQDLENEFPNYSDIAINGDCAVFVPMASKLWNGKQDLECQEISKNTFKEHLMDLLCGGQIYKTKRPLVKSTANQMIDEWFDRLNEQAWQAFWIKPDFLYTTQQAKDSGHIFMGYFENFGRDVSIAIKTKEAIYLLLVNGYC
ncbi:hypothetical protein [Moraxella oblonga]|uniref:hypothetical protein n=1 Tax=Moraxella oblonga TaxID=200413 RepID=UPI00082F41CE|nr:hypothetical protein [Moraxella oblonga]